jgi:hypothetical protein
MIADGEVVGVESGFGADTSTTAREASVTEGDSRTIAMAAVRKECGDQGSVKVVEVALGGHVGSDGIVRLSHRIDLEQVGSCVAPRVFVDATTRESSQVFDGAPRLADRARGGRSYYWDDANDTKALGHLPNLVGLCPPHGRRADDGDDAMVRKDGPGHVTDRWDVGLARLRTVRRRALPYRSRASFLLGHISVGRRRWTWLERRCRRP